MLSSIATFYLFQIKRFKRCLLFTENDGLFTWKLYTRIDNFQHFWKKQCSKKMSVTSTLFLYHDVLLWSPYFHTHFETIAMSLWRNLYEASFWSHDLAFPCFFYFNLLVNFAYLEQPPVNKKSLIFHSPYRKLKFGCILFIVGREWDQNEGCLFLC